MIMKTTMLAHPGNVKLCILFIFLVPFSLNTQAQGYLERQGNIATDFYYSSGKLGIGLTQPTAKVHIRSTGFSSEAFFKSEIFSGGYSLANVQNCVSIGGVNYGIHQTSTSRTMMNYFQD
jgi:hypothetical protein